MICTKSNELPRRKQRGIKNTEYRGQETAFYARQKEVSFPSLLYSDFLLLYACR